MNTTTRIGSTLSVATVLLLLAGCGSADESSSSGAVDVAPVSTSSTSDYQVCRNEYSAIVPAYIDYASVHCEGWTGKVFCEYDSLSSTYGPGWGQCQCYNTICETVVTTPPPDAPPQDEPRMTIKHGRACRAWWCR